MWICEDCERIFSQTGSHTVCLEEEYGVSSMLHGRTYRDWACCPYCGSYEIEDFFLPQAAAKPEEKLVSRRFRKTVKRKLDFEGWEESLFRYATR